jgi:NodT family efflux transporter outer membrane factor (OMF) lipoprotein
MSWTASTEDRQTPLATTRTRSSVLLRLLRRGAGRLAALGTLTLSLTGCTTLEEYVHNCFKVGPNYRRPPAPVAQDWIDAADVRLRKESDDLSQWWTVFNDPALDTLVCYAYRQNLTLREAGFRVLEARAQLGIAIGEIFPQQQTANGSFTQRTVSEEVANRQATPQRYFSNWQYGFSLSWELDFWGRFRRAIEAADNRLNASVEDYDDVLVTLLGDVASNYVQLRTFEQQLVYLRTNVELQRVVLTISQAQFKGGQVSELDVDQAQSILAQTESQIPQLEISIRQTTNRLCVLLGVPPEELRARLGPGAIPTAPPEVGVGMPADLLRRRPDVRRQERLAAAQCAEIGVADADFYPAISILGQLGYAAQNFPDLFNTKAFYGSVGPAFQWNILNYGRLLNNVRLQQARFQELIASYQNTVLRANAEVEDGIVTYLKAHQRVRSLVESVKAAEKAVKVGIAQYKAGTVDFNRVALLEQNLVTYQNQLAEARGQIAQGLVLIYRALGGGWQIRCNGCEPGPLPPEGPTPGPDMPPIPTATPVSAPSPQVQGPKLGPTPSRAGAPLP